MDDVRKVELSNVSKKHFPKLHERIQNKYNEMQKKIEKSKSLDMLTSLGDNFKYTEPIDVFDTDTNRNETQECFIHTEKDVKLKREVMTIKTMEQVSATYQEISCNEVVITDHVCNVTQMKKEDSENDDNFSENIFLADMCSLSKASLESLQDIGRETDESNAPPTPVSKSIRDKIGSRIIAVKERRNANREKRREARQRVEKFIFTNTLDHNFDRVLKRTKFATLTIALIEATGLENVAADEKLRFLFCRFRLGNDKRKSKLIKSNKSVVKWQELINISIYDEMQLEISLWDRDVFIGKSTVDLSLIKNEQTHRMRIHLEEAESVRIFCLLTISGTTLINTILDLDDYQNNQQKMSLARRKFTWYQTWKKFNDVGWLSVIVFGAKGLSTNDCCCILKLDNERLYTHTVYKTNAPNWMKTFSFTITDITSVLEVIVWDEKRTEEVGKVTIPLLKIETSGKKWYALKGINQKERAKGNNPRVLLEMGMTWNLVKASVRVINPKEVNLLQTEEKLDRHVFARNISRAKAIISWTMSSLQIFKSMFEWDSMKCNILALVTWLLFCWFFKVWMLPLLLLIPFALYKPSKNPVFIARTKFLPVSLNHDNATKQEKEEKNLTIRQKISSFQEMIQTVQTVIGKFASLGESVKNLFNFSVPFVSYLAIFLILVITFIMYLVPLRYILMIWGVHKFTRKLLKPNRIPNNEVLDLLSRVPDDETLLDWEPFSLENLSDEDEQL